MNSMTMSDQQGQQEGQQGQEPQQEEHQELQRQNGIVVRLFSERGYGFIKAHSGEEFFMHVRNCVGDTWQQLEEGAIVTFLPSATDKGGRANFVKLR